MTFDTHELAWAAGFFDGEGTTTLSSTTHRRKGTVHGPYYCARVSISQVEREPLERFQAAILGLGTITVKRNMGNQDGWTWAASGLTARSVTALLWKYLSTPKRDQAYRVMADELAYRRRPKKYERRATDIMRSALDRAG